MVEALVLPESSVICGSGACAPVISFPELVHSDASGEAGDGLTKQRGGTDLKNNSAWQPRAPRATQGDVKP